MEKLEKQKQIREEFDSMYKRGETPWREHEMEPALDDFFRLLKEKYPDGAKALDLACGDGWISLRAAKDGHEVYGLDSSETAIKEARQKAIQAGMNDKIHFQIGDALALPYQNGSFDILIDRSFFHHILPENRELYFQNILRVLKPESTMYLSVFSDKSPVDASGSGSMGQRFSLEQIHDLFDNDFDFLSQYEDVYPDIPPKPAHLMRFILRRKPASQET